MERSNWASSQINDRKKPFIVLLLFSISFIVFSPLFTFHCFAACFVFFLSRFITSSYVYFCSRDYQLLVAVYSCFSCFPSRSSFIVYFFLSRLFSFHFTYRLLVHFDMACLTYARETRAIHCYFPWQCHFQSWKWLFAYIQDWYVLPSISIGCCYCCLVFSLFVIRFLFICFVCLPSYSFSGSTL